MTDIINLNKMRKEKARGEKDAQAAQNRRKFGRTKEEKQREQLLAERAKKHMDGHKIDSIADSPADTDAE